MRTAITILFLIFLNVNTVISQVIDNPYYQKSDDASTVISKIERTPRFTIITFKHRSQGEGWITLSKGIYLQEADGYKMYHFVKAEGIPLMPEKKQLAKAGTELSFKVYFEHLPADVKSINIIEKAVPRDEPGSFFNFFGVSLDKSARPKMEGEVLSI